MPRDATRGRRGGPRETTDRRERCLDCELRESQHGLPLDPVGLPRRHPHYGFKMTLNCHGCAGTGRSS
jgi:hypothetical protein